MLWAQGPYPQEASRIASAHPAVPLEQLEGDRSWYHGAVEAWRSAIDLLDNEQGPLLGQLYQQLGLAREEGETVKGMAHDQAAVFRVGFRIERRRA